MLTLADVRDWIKGFNAAKNYYIGKLDNKLEYSIGIYQRGADDGPRLPIGGRKNASYDVKRITVLLHHNKNANETERRAMYLYDQLLDAEDIVIGDHEVRILDLLNSEPVDVGTDDAGVYERVIQMDIYYAL